VLDIAPFAVAVAIPPPWAWPKGHLGHAPQIWFPDGRYFTCPADILLQI